MIYDFNNNRNNTAEVYFDMCLVTFVVHQDNFGENYIYYKRLLIIRVESVYVLYFAWFLHAHLNK